MSSMEISPSGRIPALDGIRGLAITLVLWFHAAPAGLPHHPRLAWFLKFGSIGWRGVDLFFVLSGCLIGGILLDAADSPSYFSTFYIRRACRIVPLYALLLLLTVVATGTWSWLPQRDSHSGFRHHQHHIRSLSALGARRLHRS
jgi:peptidoglycan/LPS O-acetylase OafA/YrhL